VGGASLRAHTCARGGEDLRRATLDGFARLFGPRAARPERWLVQDWTAEELSRGGPVAYAPPGTLTALGRALHAPAGRIHWAGTELAERWAGYMDGAVRAGERAAAEVLSAPRAAVRASR
jgi:monoamine oxidase